MTFARLAARLAAVTIGKLGNQVTINGDPVRGQLNAPTERVIDGMAIMTGWELEYLLADLPAVNRGDLIVVDGVNFQAREDGLTKGDQATGMVPLQKLGDLPPFAPGPDRVEIEINGDIF